jgi:MarR-like DNA-binding transcriptional regulator SgrR of sgrS sRNA
VEHSSAAERARVLVRAEPGVWSISELAARCGCTPRNVRIALGSAGLLGLRRVA